LGDPTTRDAKCLANLGIGEAPRAEISNRLSADLCEPGDRALMLGKKLAGGPSARDRVCDGRYLLDVVRKLSGVLRVARWRL
jgi:hypothetical protein